MRRLLARRRRFMARLALALSAFVLVALAGATAAFAGGTANVTTNAMKWNLVVGFALPPVISFVKRSNWPTAVQSLVAFAASAAAAVGIAYWQATLSWSSWTESALTILVVTIATYHGFWKPTGIDGKVAGLVDVKPAAKTTRRR